MPYKCKEAARTYRKAYRETNKEKIKARDKSYSRAYREANKEKIKAYYQANKEKMSVNNKTYYQANKGKAVARAAKRKALKLKQIPIHLRDCPREKERIEQTYKLCYLITKATGVQHHVDHMWPLSKKGPHWSGNLQIITATENLTKNAKLNKDIKATVREMLKDIKDAY